MRNAADEQLGKRSWGGSPPGCDHIYGYMYMCMYMWTAMQAYSQTNI